MIYEDVFLLLSKWCRMKRSPGYCKKNVLFNVRDFYFSQWLQSWSSVEVRHDLLEDILGTPCLAPCCSIVLLCRTKMDVELLAPYDLELNPDGEVKENGMKRPKTRWDAGPKPQIRLPHHWREITQVGGRPDPSPEEKLWREMVQKILYADAVCRTTTPTEALDLLLHF